MSVRCILVWREREGAIKLFGGHFHVASNDYSRFLHNMTSYDYQYSALNKSMFLAAVLCAYCAATMKLLWTLTSTQPTLQLRVECCDHGVCIVCSVAGMIFASPFKFSHDMRRRNIFIYLGPITTSVGFHFLSALWFGRNVYR